MLDCHLMNHLKGKGHTIDSYIPVAGILSFNSFLCFRIEVRLGERHPEALHQTSGCHLISILTDWKLPIYNF